MCNTFSETSRFIFGIMVLYLYLLIQYKFYNLKWGGTIERALIYSLAAIKAMIIL